MTFIHFRNDFSVDISLSSKALGTTIDPDFIYSITFFTRPNGKRYKCCYNSNTLIKKDGYVTAILNNAGLECGLLKYEVEFELYSQEYPDYHKRIFQTYPSDIELVKSNGETEDIDVQQMFGTTIDDKFNSYDASILGLSTTNAEIQANIVSIQELNTVQDTSINRIEEMLKNFDPSGSDAVQRLDTSVDLITRDVSSLNSSVNSLYTQTEENATGLVSVTNTVNDVSTRVNDVETVLGRKADASVLTNYYTKDETYNKDEVDLAIANAALDGSLPEGIVIDNNYVHTDNNYTTEDKNKVRDFDLSLYPTNSSLSANYATKAELQNVDENHPSNSSVSSNYVKKNDMSNYLSDYPTNSSVSSNYATKAQVQGCIDENDLTDALADYPTNASVSGNYTTERYVNENYVSWENLDEAVFNLIDNNYDVQWKINEVVNDSSTISDISTNVSDVSIKVDDVSVKVKGVSLVSLDISTRLNNDYLTAQVVNRDFVKNASLNDYVLNSSLSTNYTTKDEFNEVWTTFVTADQVDDTYAKIVDVSNHLTTNDISTFKPIVFCTQEEYDELVDSSTVDANTVYMLSGDQTGGDYLTPDDVSNFVTTNDISTFITENDVSNFVTDSDLDDYLTADDASIYVKEDFGALSTDTKKTIVKYKDSSNLGELSFYIQKNAFNMAHQSNGNMLKFDSVYVTKNSKPYNLQRIAFNGMWGTSTYNANNYGSITFMRGISNSSVFNDNLEWGSGNYNEGSDFKWATIFVDDNGFGLLKYSGFNRVVTRYATTNQLTDVSNYVSTNYASKNDISTFITSNDVSIYATTSYVDTQIGNIQNILSTI